MSPQHHQLGTRPFAHDHWGMNVQDLNHSISSLRKAHSMPSARIGWYVPVMPLPGRKKQEDREPQTFLTHTVKPCFRRQTRVGRSLSPPQRILIVLPVDNVTPMSKFKVCSETRGRFLVVKIKHADTIAPGNISIPKENRGYKGRTRPESCKRQAGQPFSPTAGCSGLGAQDGFMWLPTCSYSLYFPLLLCSFSPFLVMSVLFSGLAVAIVTNSAQQSR